LMVKKHLIFGNPAIPVGPVALRPRVAPGLPLSESYIWYDSPLPSQ
jgi:hypothetical protein